MSWAAEEWKDGLPQKALVKITQIEAQLERFKKERDQKQFQLESLEQALEVQKRKGGNEKSEIAALKRENQSLTENCHVLEKKKEKLASDLLLKEKEVTSLEQKLTEVNGQHSSGKSNGSVGYQQETESQGQSQIIASLEQEITELRKKLKENDEINQAARRGAGEEASCTKSLRHPTEGDELRKSQQELQTLRSLISEVELRNNKLIKEGECARHNAEAARQHLESKMKENEKELKRELAQALETTKNAERVLQESKSRWQQEINAQKLASELSQKDQDIQARLAEIIKLKNDIGLKEQANDSLKGQLMDKTLEQEIIRAEADKTSQKCLQAENQLMDLQKQKLKADDHLKDVSMSLNQLQNEKEKLEKSSTDLNKQLEKLHGEVEMLSASLKNSQTQMTEADSNFKESQHKWKDLESTLRSQLDQSLSSLTQMTELKTEMEKQLSAKDGELLELLNQCRTSQEKINSKDSEISQKDQNITELEKQLQTLLDQHDSLQKEQHQQQMLSLEKMVHTEESLKKKTEEVEMIEIKYSQEKAALEAEIEQLLSQKNMIELEIKSSRADCENGKNVIISLNDEIETLKAELEVKVTTLFEVDSVIENKQRELQEKTEETAALGSEIKQRDQHINFMKDSLTSAEKELEKSHNELQFIGEKCEKLESEKASFISEIAECTKQIECGVQVEELHNKQMTELQGRFEVLQNECFSLSSQANLDYEKRSHLEKEVTSLQNKCIELEARISDHKTEIEKKSAAAGKLEEQCLQLSDKLDAEKAENSININKLSILDIQLSESNKLHQEVVGEMSEKLADTIKCLDELKGLLEQKENRLFELEKETIRLRNSTLELDMLCKSLKDELNHKAVLIVALEEKCTFLSEELAGAELKISEKERQLSTNLENLSQVKCQVSQLEDEKTTLELSSNKELHNLQEQLLQQLENLNQKDLRITALEDHNKEISAKLSMALQELSESDTKHALENEMLKSKLEMIQMDIEDTDGLTQDLNGKILNLTSMLENMTQERNSLQKTSQSMCVDLDELKSVLETEKSYLDQLKHEQRDLTEKHNNLEITLVNIQAELEGKNTLLAEKDASLENVQKMALEYDKQLKELEVEKDQLVIQINYLQLAVSTGIESDVSKTQEIERLSETCSLLSDNLEKVTELLSEQNMEISLKTQSIQAIELKLKDLEQHSLEYQEKTQKQIEDLNKHAVEREEALAQIAARREELESSTDDLSNKLLEVERLKSEEAAQREQEIATLKSKLELLDMDVEDKDDTVQELNTKISDLQNQIEVMSQEKVKMNEAATCFESELLELKSALDEEREKLAHSKMSDETLNERINNLGSALADARCECEEKDKYLQSLQSECEKISKINTEYEHQSTQLQDEKEKLVSRIEDLLECLDLERQTVQVRTSDLDAVTQQFEEMSKNLINLRQELSQHQEELAAKVESLDQMGGKLKHQESEITGLKDASSKDLDRLQQNLSEKDVQLSESTSRIEFLENQTMDLEVKLKDALSTKSEKAAQHEQEIAALKSQLELLDMDVEDKDDTVQELNTKISDLQNQIEVMSQEKVKMNEAATCFESELLELKSALDEEREKLAHSKMSDETLNERINNLGSALADARCECEEKEKYLQSLQSECEKISKINTEYEHQSTQLQDEKEKLVARIEDLLECLDLERQTVQVRTSDLDAVTQQFEEMSKNLINLRQELSQHQEELAAKVESLDQMGGKLKQQESEITGLKDASSKDLDRLQQSLSEKDVQLSESTSRIEFLENHTMDLEVKLKDALSTKSEKAAQHGQEIAALKSQLELLDMDVEDKDDTVQELNTKISNLQNQIEVMSQEKVKMSEAATCFESELLELKSVLAEEREKLAHSKMSDETLNERINNLGSALSDARCECEEKEKYLQSLQSECEKISKINTEYEHQSTQLQDEKEKLVARIEDLLECLDLERQTVQVRTSDLDAVTQQFEEMSKNLINLRQELSQHQEELAAKVESLDQMGGKLKQQESEITGLKDASSKDLDRLQQSLSEKDVQLSESTSRIEFLENHTMDLEVKLKDALSTKSEKAAQHGQEIAALKSQLELLDMDVEDKDDTVQELNTKISNLQNQIEVMSQEKVKMSEAATCFESELLELKSVLAEEREKLAHSKMSDETLNERINNLGSALSDARCECEEKEKYLQCLQSECDIRRDTIIKYEESVLKLQNDKDKLTEIISNLQKISCSDKVMFEVKTSELDTVNNESSLFNEHELSKINLAQTEEELSIKEQNSLMMEDKIEQLEKEIKHLQAVLVDNEEALREKSSRIVDLENYNQDLEVQLSGTNNMQLEECAPSGDKKAMLNSNTNIPQVDLKVTEDIIDDLHTELTNLREEFENLTKEKAGVEELYHSAEAELLSLKVDLNAQMDNHIDTRKCIERQKETVKLLEASLVSVRVLLLRQESNFINSDCEKPPEKLSAEQTNTSFCDQEMDKSYLISDLESSVSSMQEIASCIFSEIEALSIYCTELREKLATATIEVSSTKDELHNLNQSFRLIKAKCLQFMLDKKLLEETSNKDADKLQELLYIRNINLIPGTSQIDELQLQLVSRHDKLSEANAIDDETCNRKDDSSEMDEVKGIIEQKGDIINAVSNEATNPITSLCLINEEYHTVKNTKSLQESHDIFKEEFATGTQDLQVTDFKNTLTKIMVSFESKEQHIFKIECQLKEALEGSDNLKLSINEKLDEIKILKTIVKNLEQQQELIINEKSDAEKHSTQEMEIMSLQMSTIQENLESKSNDLILSEIQNDDLNKSMSQLNLRLAELQAGNTAVYEQLDEVRKLLTEAKSDLLKRDDTNCILREELDDALHENDALKTDRGEWQIREEKFKQEINDLEVKLTDLNTEIESTRESFECLSDQRFEAQSKLQNVLLENKDLENKLTNFTIELAGARRVNDNLQDLTVELESLKQKVISKDDEIENLKIQLGEISSSEKSELIELDLLRKQKEELEMDFNEVQKRSKDLEEQLYEFTAVIKEMKEQLAQLQDLILTLNKNVDSKNKEIVQRVNEISEKNDEISQLKAAIDDAEKANIEMSKQITNIQKENNSTVGTLQDAIESLNYELLDAEKDKTSLTLDNELLKTENVELNEKVKTLMKEVIQFESQLNGLTDLEKANAEFNIQINSLENGNKELKIKLEEKAKHVSDLLMEVESLNEQLQKIACENLSLEIETLRVEASSFLMQLEEKEAQLCHSREIEKSLSASVSEMDNKMSVLQNDLESSKEKVITLKEENDKFLLECEQLKNQNLLLKEEVAKESHDAITAKESLDKKDEVLDKVIADKRELEQRIRDYDLVVLERDQLRERVKTLQFVEVDKQKLEEKFEQESNEKSIYNEIVQELEEVLIGKVNIDNKLEDVKVKKAALLEKVTQLQTDNSQLDNCMKEMDQKVKHMTREKCSLQEMIKNMEFDNGQLEENLKELDQKINAAIFEKSSLQEIIKNLESDNCQLEEKLKELNLNIQAMTFEKGSLQEIMKKMESENSQLEEKVKEMETLVSEHSVVKENYEEQERTLGVKTNELHRVMAEKDQLENKLKELQVSHTLALNAENGDKPTEHNDEKHKELLRKWEQRCSELNCQLSMDRKKVQRLTEQVEKLKSSKQTENVEDITTLKEELEEVKQEREAYKEKYLKMSQAGERHCTRSKELQRQNEKLNSRNRLLNALLKGEKPKKIEPILATTSIPLDKAQQLQVESSIKSSVEMAEVIPEISTDSQCKEKVQTIMHVRFDLGSHVPSPNSDIAKVNNTHSVSKKDINFAATQEQLSSTNGELNVPGAAVSADVKDTNSLYSNRCSPRVRRNSPKLQSAQKSNIATPKPNISTQLVQSNSKIATPKSNISSQLVQSTQKQKREIPSKIITPGSKIKSHTVEPGVLKMASSPSKLMSSSQLSSASKFPNRSKEPIKILPSLQNVNAPDQLRAIPSPRATRQLSLQKRRSTDQSTEMAGGKKFKLLVKETLTEASSECESKNSMQHTRLPQPVQSKLGTTSGLLRPMITRSKKDHLLVENALTTITNSPKKVTETRARRQNRNQAIKTQQPAQQSENEGTSDCKIT